MKSSEADLRKRGMITRRDADALRRTSYQDLMRMTCSADAAERTAAVRILAEHYSHDADFTAYMLKKLYTEKSLYTKIEICAALKKGNAGTAEQMTAHLGKIGKNQYKELPPRVSSKISYPLPRDIIARTLAHMSPEIFPVLLRIADSNDEQKISEVLDAIGLMVFYHQELVTETHLAYIKDKPGRHTLNQIIRWKYTLCLSAFPLQKSIYILEKIKTEENSALIVKEAERSLNLISGRLL